MKNCSKKHAKQKWRRENFFVWSEIEWYHRYSITKAYNVHLKSRKMYFLKIDKSSFFRIKRKRTLGKI